MDQNSIEPSHIPPWISADPRVSVGRYTYGQPRILIWSEDERVKVGSFCSISDDVTIFAGGEHNHHWVTTFPLRLAFYGPLIPNDGHPATKGETVIGHDVWIGFGATILSGVVIGDGAVIGARSVVTQDVPPYAIYAGNPATFKKFRFDADTVYQLLQLKWWTWPLEKIKENTHLLCSQDTKSLLLLHGISTPKTKLSPGSFSLRSFIQSFFS